MRGTGPPNNPPPGKPAQPPPPGRPKVRPARDFMPRDHWLALANLYPSAVIA